jgi:hypothetical protein
MAGAVFQPIVPGEQYERRGVRRLDDDVGDHHLQFFDSYGGASRGQRIGGDLRRIHGGVRWLYHHSRAVPRRIP